MSKYAYPQTKVDRSGVVISYNTEGGLTLRDYFAAKAMQALVQSSQTMNHVTTSMVAGEAYIYADEMIKAREVK